MTAMNDDRYEVQILDRSSDKGPWLGVGRHDFFKAVERARNLGDCRIYDSQVGMVVWPLEEEPRGEGTLWVLRPREKWKGVGPWDGGYDRMYGIIVYARSETEARRVADENGGDEVSLNCSPWLEEAYSTCERLEQTGEVGRVLRDFRAG